MPWNETSGSNGMHACKQLSATSPESRAPIWRASVRHSNEHIPGVTGAY
jgi:hypothetical protein